MRKFLMIALLAAATPAFAAADLAKDTMLGKTEAEISSKLKNMGYEIRKSDMEDGYIEFYIVKNNKMSEIYVSPKTGKVTKIKAK